MGEARSAKTRVFSFQGPSPARYILPVSPNPLDTTKKTRRRPDGNPSPAARATTDNAEPGSGGRATPSDQRWQLLFSGAAIIGQKEEALVLWPRTHLVELSELAELVPQVALLARAAEVSDPHLRSGYVSHDLYVLIRCCSRFSFSDKKGECLVLRSRIENRTAGEGDGKSMGTHGIFLHFEKSPRGDFSFPSPWERPTSTHTPGVCTHHRG